MSFVRYLLILSNVLNPPIVQIHQIYENIELFGWNHRPIFLYSITPILVQIYVKRIRFESVINEPYLRLFTQLLFSHLFKLFVHEKGHIMHWQIL